MPDMCASRHCHCPSADTWYSDCVTVTHAQTFEEQRQTRRNRPRPESQRHNVEHVRQSADGAALARGDARYQDLERETNPSAFATPRDIGARQRQSCDEERDVERRPNEVVRLNGGRTTRGQKQRGKSWQVRDRPGDKMHEVIEALRVKWTPDSRDEIERDPRADHRQCAALPYVGR